MTKRLAAYYGLSLLLLGAVVGAVVHFVPADTAQNVNSNAGAFGALLANFESPLAHALLQLVVIVVAARAVGSLMSRIGQPAVIGEMAVGIALGPSLLGATLPSVSGFLFPPQSLGVLSILSQIGILLFMFVIGMEMDLKSLRQGARSVLLISHASIVAPFILGLSSAVWLYTDYVGSNRNYLAFALFMGISMSITAFPVLARIIKERGLAGTSLGTLALSCAAVNDATAWIALAFIVALARAQNLAGCFVTIGLVLATGLFVFRVVSPALDRAVSRRPDPGAPGKTLTVAVIASVFGCALATEVLGIHALFGAFLAGLAMPSDERFRGFLRQRLEYFSTLLLVPIFFAFTGLRTQIGLLSSGTDWLICGGILGLAILGKLGGSMLAARASGMSWRSSASLGALMNTRGLVELIALNMGLDLGVLSPKIFSMLVLMALVTTFMTGPLVSLLKVGRWVDRDGGVLDVTEFATSDPEPVA